LTPVKIHKTNLYFLSNRFQTIDATPLAFGDTQLAATLEDAFLEGTMRSSTTPLTMVPPPHKKIKLVKTKRGVDELGEIRDLQRKVLEQQLLNQQQFAGVLRSAECAFDALNNLLPHIAHYFPPPASSKPRSPPRRFSL